MNRSELIMSVLKFVEEFAFDSPDELLEEYKANKDLESIASMSLEDAFFMDELDYTELIMEMEDELPIHMRESDWPDWYNDDVTIGKLVAAIIKSGDIEITD